MNEHEYKITDYRLGTGKSDITPPFALPFAGFAHRSGDYTGVSRRL
ncbi:hypothetical protein [Paenibacillus eucommiae]|uniref:Uncharacterized protein n=1 Tax=Paenibacillus eucommiae TaxID=1355755 RepID=A0ABS4IMR0_9BACL|nr:hypothetical protein [Paenibacillus eucommiae]MBP1988847.1 hypothetical protein [Paenibacillus eucommiae]